MSNGSANLDAPIEAASCPPKAPSVCRRWALRLCMGLSFLVLVFFGLLWAFWSQPYGGAPFPKEVEIPSGAGLSEVAVMLQRQGLLRSPKAFVAMATLRGQQGRIQAGQYRFEGPVSPRALLQRFTRGEVFLHRITFPEGWTLEQVAERLASEGLVNRDRFIARATDPEFTANLLGFQALSLEGFLFPDTYHFPSGWEEERILAALVKRFHQVYDEGLRARTKETGWSIPQVVTLASLIEKESALPRERPLISGVFHRRLMRGMRLESDPSVIYGLENFDGDLRRADLENPHPYNTYRISGLPPGPICNPSIASIRAALYPIDEGYLYFVSRNDGSHHFSHTFREHMVAVARYQSGRNGR